MTREEAILCLKGIKNYGRDTFTEQSDWQNSLDIAIKALEQEPCDDAISRQAVFDLMRSLTRWCVRSEDGKFNNVGLLYDDVMFGIDKLPSVNLQEPKWISVSERLPEDEDYVLVCYADGSIGTAYYYIDTESYPPEFRDCCETGWYNDDEDYIYQDVIAWMPLPKPYELQKSEG